MTLTQTAILTKQIITITLIALIVGTISFIGYRIWYTHYLSTLPKVEEKPDTKFGVLPSPDFPKTSVSSSNFSYSLDTTTGGLPKIGVDPTFERLVKVYFVIKPYATFLSPDKSRTLAEKFNIKVAPLVLNETTYEFKQENKALIVDLDSDNFRYFKEASPSAQSQDTDDKLISDFKRSLETLGVLKEELKKGRAKVTPLDKGITLVSIWPEDLDKKPILTSDVNKSQVNAEILGSAASLEDYISLNFSFYKVDTSTFATYPIKSPEEAFNDLRRGKGVVIVEPQKPQVSITSVSLGYYLAENYSPYIQPIFVFEGPNFISYVPAISSQFLKL